MVFFFFLLAEVAFCRKERRRLLELPEFASIPKIFFRELGVKAKAPPGLESCLDGCLCFCETVWRNFLLDFQAPQCFQDTVSFAIELTLQCSMCRRRTRLSTPPLSPVPVLLNVVSSVTFEVTSDALFSHLT